MSSSSTTSEQTPNGEPAPGRWFAEKVQPHEPLLRSYLRSSFPSVRDVDDLVQESYLRIWRRQTAHPIKSAKAFLFTIARHLAMDWIRQENRSKVDSVGEMSQLCVLDERSSVVRDVNRAEKVQLLIAAIDSLPRRCREVLVLRKLKLLSQKEVAQRLGISEKGVEIQLNRGVTRCREYLRQRGVYRFFDDEL